MLSLYRIFGGIALVLLALTFLPVPMDIPGVRIVLGIFLLVAGVALLVGM